MSKSCYLVFFWQARISSPKSCEFDYRLDLRTSWKDLPRIVTRCLDPWQSWWIFSVHPSGVNGRSWQVFVMWDNLAEYKNILWIIWKGNLALNKELLFSKFLSTYLSGLWVYFVSNCKKVIFMLFEKKPFWIRPNNLFNYNKDFLFRKRRHIIFEGQGSCCAVFELHNPSIEQKINQWENSWLK